VYDEFAKNVLLTNSVPRNWFHNTTAGKFNLQNGVYDMHTGELKPHSSEFGFTHILPYEYDPSALCPTFDKFMKDVTKEREDLTQSLLEYVGYGLSNDECWLQKAVILTGSGANGKSTFCDVIRGLAGKNNVAAQRLERLGNPVVNALIQNKLINISEETGAGAFFSAEDFKELVAGGSMNVKQLYKNQYEVLNRTKFMILCNELPTATDGSHGFFRRLVIVPFDARFDEGNRDPFIKDKLLTELAGIFNIVVKHYKNLVNRGVLASSQTSSKTIERYKFNSDIAASWIADHFELKEDSKKEDWVASVEVYQEYSQNCQYDWGVKPVSIVKFWQKVEAVFRDLDFHDRRMNIRRNGKQQWVIKGLVRKELPDESF
jgi:putative DNA primase/helicase